MARYAQLTLVCGRRGTGKTNYTLGQLYKAVNVAKRKVLIYDVTDEFGNYIYRPGEPPHKIKAIYFKDIQRFSVQKYAEIVRTRPYTDDNQRMSNDDLQEYLFYVLKNFRNGTLLVEDVNVYISDNAPNDVMGSLATLRQAGVDVIAQYQLIGKAANPKMLGMANYIRLHKTNDSVERYKDRFLDKTDILMVAEQIVNRRYMHGMKNKIKDHTGEFFHCLVDFNYHKIRGIFNKGEAEFAISEYINNHAAMTIGKMMKKKDKQGKLVNTSYANAYATLEQQYMDDFFDFK